MNFRVVTVRGWGWLIASLILLVMGLTQGWLEMVGLGVAGLVSFGFATLYAFFRHAHKVSFALSHSRVVAGSPAELIVSVVNPTNRSLQGLDIFIPVGEEELSSRVCAGNKPKKLCCHFPPHIVGSSLWGLSELFAQTR